MSTKNIVIIVLAALFVLFVVQNTRIVEVQILFWTVSMSRSLMLLATLLIGLIGGWFLGRANKKTMDRTALYLPDSLNRSWRFSVWLSLTSAVL